MIQGESVGHLSGTLDVARYAERSYWGGGPPSYPVTNVVRSSETPENILTTYAGLWAIWELEHAANASNPPSESPEARAVLDLTRRIERLLASPVLRPCRSAASDVLRRDADEGLVEQVESRLRRGEIAHSEPYEGIVDLVKRLRESQPSGLAGDGTWSFYDESFDTRLFELWTAFALAKGISDALRVDLPPLAPEWRGSGLAFTWERPTGTLELFMQKSLHVIENSKRSRWRREGAPGRLGGIPDIVIRATNRNSSSRWAIIDAKLRQRSGPPAEELYKVLGYFGNYELEDDPYGAIVFHAPSAEEPNTMTYVPEDENGRLVATALNPANLDQVRQGLTEVVDMVLALLGISALPQMDSQVEGGEAYIERLLVEMRVVAGQILPGSLDESRRRVLAMVGEETWDRLGSDIQDMLATGEHVGFTLDQQRGDFSGPVLSLIVPLEILVHEYLWLPATAGDSASQSARRRTIGQIVSAIFDALDGAEDARSEALRNEIVRKSLPEVALRGALYSLRDINRDFRNRAAHKEKMSWRDWNEIFARILTRDRVLPNLLHALQVGSSVRSSDDN